MEIINVLKTAGLDEKEALVYLGLLELGTASVQVIASKAGLKRPTTYLILDSLQAKGMVSIVPRAKKALYTAESPEKIIGDLHKKQEMVKRFMPNMLALYNAKVEKPQIQLFEGKEGVLEVYKKVFASPTVDFFCNISDVMGAFSYMPGELKDLALAKKIKVRELLTQGKDDIIHAAKMPQHEYYENRFVPKNMEFLTDNVFFKNSVAFFSYSPYLFAVVITSTGVVTSLKTIFEMAWQSAETYDKVINKK
jgi:sugar-specific transcriptional regulator TrmB